MLTERMRVENWSRKRSEKRVRKEASVHHRMTKNERNEKENERQWNVPTKRTEDCGTEFTSYFPIGMQPLIRFEKLFHDENEQM